MFSGFAHNTEWTKEERGSDGTKHKTGTKQKKAKPLHNTCAYISTVQRGPTKPHRCILTHLLLHHAGLVGVESETLTVDELLLQLLLALPATVLDGQANVGRVRPRGVGEDAGGGVPDGEAELLGLLNGVLADEVFVLRLVRLGGHLDLMM